MYLEYPVCLYFFILSLLLVNGPQVLYVNAGMFPAGTRRPGTYRGPSGDCQGMNTKANDLMRNLFFRSNCPCTSYQFLFSTGRTNI